MIAPRARRSRERRWTEFAAVVIAAMALATSACGVHAETLPPPRVLDDFESSAAWTALPASGVEMKLTAEPGPHGNALRVDFQFTKGGGYAVLHRNLALDLPVNYRFEFRLRGATAPQNLEFKLLDESGENVWWCNQVNHEYPREWTTERIRKRQISYAWGPLGGGELRHAAAIEFAITAGSGGRGTVWFDELTLVTLPVPGTPPAVTASASSQARGHDAALAVDTSATTDWESAPGDTEPALTLELGTLREFGGVVLDWVVGRHPRDYVLEADEGMGTWRELRRVRSSDGGRDWLELPESEARRLRVRPLQRLARTIALANVEIEPLEWGATAEHFLSAVARNCPRGHYPRGFLGEQSYWTVIGVDGADEEGLLDEDARLETGRAQFSLEPFVVTEQGVRNWSHGNAVALPEPQALPIPSVKRTFEYVELRVTAFARGPRESSELVARYRVRNLAPESRRITLAVAIRPFQVNPPSQFLNVAGGPARVSSLARSGARVRVNDGRELVFAPPPDRFGAMTFDEGDFVAHLEAGTVPRRDSLRDPVARASGVLWWVMDLGPGEVNEVVAVVPLRAGGASRHAFLSADAAGWQSAAERDWNSRLGTFGLKAGGSGGEIAATLRAQLGYVLVNRDGAGIQPGSRSYERSWIRDGSLTSSALLRSGMREPVRNYLEWYAKFQYADGKVPCCVDRRGSDPVPEHDSHGEFIFLAAEYLRLTGDTATVRPLWPHVRAATAYLDTLRAQRRTAEWRTRANAPYFGLLPPSISHEGYSAKPMHSYWDDLFALRGYKDAAWLAGTLGERADASWIRASRDQFARDFAAAARAAMLSHRIDYVPGCSDLGDFDATSTTIAFSPVQMGPVLPAAALERTFERYWEFFKRRRDGLENWDAYTPYELRNVGAFVRLGWRERANELLDWFMQDRRPAGWRQWAEVVDHEPRHARFLGDMPHTWVGTDFVRSVQEMLAYERERDSSLVIGAGIPEDWLEEGGVRLDSLQTRWGLVSYVLRREGGRLLLSLDPSGLRTPPGGIEFAPPGVRRATNGSLDAVRVEGRLIRILSPDGRYRWRPSRDSGVPPHSIEWGHQLPVPPGR